MRMRIRTLALLALAAAVPILHGCATIGAGAAAAQGDRRTSGVYIEDQSIESKATRAIEAKYGKDDRVHVSVASFNRYVLLSGEVPDEETKRDIGVIALGVQNVRNVQNELVVGPAVSMSQRRRDGYTTATVKTRFAQEKKFNASLVKVVTDDNTVFLMGLVTPQEADAATEIARNTTGVTKVVRVFELMN
jgi:osmotically-inducible protein OsmY